MADQRYVKLYHMAVSGAPRNFENLKIALYRHGMGRRAILGFNPYALHRDVRESAREIHRASLSRRSGLGGYNAEPRKPMGFGPKREEPRGFFPMPGREPGLFPMPGRGKIFHGPEEPRRPFFPRPR